MSYKKRVYRGFAHQSGLTIIELMIAMLLSLVLMASVVQIFLSSKQTFNLQSAQSRIQEDGRLAMYFLPRYIRMADFQGCLSRQQYNTNVIANATVKCPSKKDCAPDLDLSTWDPNGGITGEDNVASGKKVGDKDVIPGTDTINIQYIGSCGGHLKNNMDADNAMIQINADNTCNLKPDWPFMITDCLDADIARATSVSNGTTTQTIAHANNVNTDNKLSKAYQADAEIFALQSFTYFVAQNTIGNNSLYRRDNLSGQSDEIVEGVEDLQVLYGEDSNDDKAANYYVDAKTTNAMEKVVSVKVSLLLRSVSEGNVTSKPVAYTFNNVTYNDGTTPAPLVDRQLRKVFTSTITLRNRLP